MNFLFGKKKTVTSLAEVLENGTPKMLAWSQLQREQAGKPFQQRESYTKVPTFQILARVLPVDGVPFDAQMETSLIEVNHMKPGVRVLVEYDPNKLEHVKLVDNLQTILANNPQLVEKKPVQASLPVSLCPHCGKYYEGTPRFCPNCGQPVA